ncbi:MAG: site-2 protease family protein [Magnetococcales bacterium]|nr:site-2 protease family protein [Magnetococcales bacterium]MBF0150010.1 site-2 protease family protein [Magnetococcales bacterium]MBF0174235.1 site-2 protease family protein [Magnetococcales bacterium]MBF0347763.1 site-2 protease family protein [Magnetococcales bacterium]MBF0632882.1 site-2 protease family protein [Magnetococcales bacterium]
MMTTSEIITGIITWAPGIIFAVTLHEWAHGFAATRFGDPTPAIYGRLTLKPWPHIDPLWSIVIPVVMLVTTLATTGHPVVFGGAKPVPINPNNFSPNSFRLALLSVAIAGPLMNIILALICALLLRLVFFLPLFMIDPLASMLVAAIQMNVLLAVFNMLPVPPLDGGRVATALLPFPLNRKLAGLEKFGLPIIIILAFSGNLGSLLHPPMQWALSMFYSVAGLD